MLTDKEIEAFKRDGFLVLPQIADAAFCEQIIAFAQQQLDQNQAPIEYEADTRYPGAPISRDAEGGLTARRVLQVLSRHPALLDWASQGPLAQGLRQLLGSGLRLVQAHHNCIMTKQARFSSVTGWHRDSRYWHFERPALISAWLALRDETVENGCLLVIPGSHLLDVSPDRMDEAKFLRSDLAQNQALLAQARAVPLRQGDGLLFHSNLFHAAGCNQTTQTKFSFVTTYRSEDNPPIAGTRSTSVPEIVL